MFGELRQGALDALVQEGVAEAYGVPAAAVRRAAMLLCSTTAAAAGAGEPGAGRRWRRSGCGSAQPVRPMLAASAPDPADALAKTGLPALVDAKLDGIRVQVHRDGDDVRVFTRSLDDITDRVPEVVAAVARAAAPAAGAGRRGAGARAPTAAASRSRSSRPAP